MFAVIDKRCIMELLEIIEKHDDVNKLTQKLSITEFATFADIIHRIGLKKFMDMLDFALNDELAYKINRELSGKINPHVAAYDRINVNLSTIDRLEISEIDLRSIERSFSNFHVIADIFKIPVGFGHEWIATTCKELIRTANVLNLGYATKNSNPIDRQLVLICIDVGRYFKIYDALTQTHSHYLTLDRILRQFRN